MHAISSVMSYYLNSDLNVISTTLTILNCPRKRVSNIPVSARKFRVYLVIRILIAEKLWMVRSVPEKGGG